MKYRLHAVPGVLYVHCYQRDGNQGVLEGNLLARCAHMAEGSCPSDAIHRAVWYLYQALGPDDPSLCQHDGRTCHSHLADVSDFRHVWHPRSSWCGHGTRQRCYEYLYDAARGAGVLHPGYGVHHAIGSIHLSRSRA